MGWDGEPAPRCDYAAWPTVRWYYKFMETELKIEAYCLKDKSKQVILEPKEDKFSNGTPILVGKCSKCGGKLFKIMKKATK